MSNASKRATKPTNAKVGGNQKAIGRDSKKGTSSDVIRAGSKPSKANSDSRKNFSKSGMSKHF